MNTETIKMLELFCGIGSIRKCLCFEEFSISIVSDRRSAVLLVKGKLSKKKQESSGKKEEKEIKIYVIFVPVSFQVLAKILTKIIKSKIARIVREITEKVIIEVAKKELVDYVLSKIPDRKEELVCFTLFV